MAGLGFDILGVGAAVKGAADIFTLFKSKDIQKRQAKLQQQELKAQTEEADKRRAFYIKVAAVGSISIVAAAVMIGAAMWKGRKGK